MSARWPHLAISTKVRVKLLAKLLGFTCRVRHKSNTIALTKDDEVSVFTPEDAEVFLDKEMTKTLRIRNKME